MSKTRLATQFKTAEDSPGFLLWQLTNKWQARQRAALKPFGLTHVQFVLLATLTYLGEGERIMQKQLADSAQTDIMMTSQVLRKLEQKGLVQRASHASDGRARHVSSTSAGITLANRAVKAVEAVDAEFFGGLDAGDRRALLSMMSVLAKS